LRPKSIEVDPNQPQQYLLQEAVDVILGGGIVAFPTDTTYGLGVNPFDDKAVGRVFELKQRHPNKPLIILINDKQQINQLAVDISPTAYRLMDEFWPGPLTLIFKTSAEIASFRIGETTKIGIRLPQSLIAQELIQLAKIPVTASSANPSGAPSSRSAQQVLEYFGKRVDFIIDGGPASSQNESSVLDVTTDPPQLIRAGAISPERIRAVTEVGQG
jgi:L-threonylcarbamoyladenylate synthase